MIVQDQTSPPSDELRVAALHRLAVLDQPRRQDLDGLARLAAYVCDTPTAAINLIDLDRQWSAAAHGWEPFEVSRQDSMCATSILSHDVSYTADASTDPRWAQNPWVAGGEDPVRFYAAAPLVLPGGEVIGTVCAFSPESVQLSRLQLERLRDVADQAVLMLELQDATSRLGRAALRDGLTGLPNRALFEESLQFALARHERGEARPAVVFLDLDGFKGVNDAYGHAVGDELLCAVTDRLLRTVRGSDLLARLGGDELVILCEFAHPPESTDDAPVFLSRLRASFDEPFVLSCGPVSVGVSIGLSVADGSTGPELLARADAAMYADKRERRAGR